MYTLEDVTRYLDKEGIVSGTHQEARQLYEHMGKISKDPVEKWKKLAQTTPRGISLYDHITSFNRKALETKLIAIRELIGSLDGKKILDAGCGTGLETVFFGMHVGNGYIMGIDTSEPMIERAKERLRKHPSARVRLQKADMGNLELDGGSLDIAFAMKSLGENAKPGDNRKPIMVNNSLELKRVLRSKGRLITSGEYMNDDDRDDCIYRTQWIADELELDNIQVCDFGYKVLDTGKLMGTYVIAMEKP